MHAILQLRNEVIKWPNAVEREEIRYYFAGCPGSVHDNRVYKLSQLYLNAGEMFSNRQYTLADSAYENSNHMVSAYRRYRGNVLTER